MSSTDSDVALLGKGGNVPMSPFEIQVTKDAIQRHLDNGDITREDIEILKRSYRWMTISSLVGAASGIPVFFALKRRVPPPPTAVRFAATGAMMMTGSFLGFSMGGAAAAFEVNNKMPDAAKKLKVFQQIVIDSKRAALEHRAGLDPNNVNPDGSPRTIAQDAQQKKNESSYAWGQAESRPDSSYNEGAARPRAPPQNTGYGSREQTQAQRDDSTYAWDNAEAAKDAVINEGSRAPISTWERLRTQRPAKPSGVSSNGAVDIGANTGANAGGDPKDELQRQQAEFDRMLDRERKGGEALDKW